nr:uncharacterized protein LOC111414003 [Onthophagus taurus]
MFIFYHFHYFTEAFLIIISTLSVVIGLIFIYTIQKVVEDFKFCNYYPSPYFISALKFAAGSALCIFLYMLLYFKSYTIQNLTPRLAYLALLKNIAFILPMILILMYQCYTSSKPKKKQSCLAKMTEAVSPSKAWGPLDVLAKKARKKYYSKRDEIYHQTKLTKCAHNCLLHENSLEEINHYGTINLEKLQTKIESQKATEETEMILREIQQFTKAKHVEK